MRNKIAVIGECMLEISSLASGDEQHALPAQLSYGGDTLNTSIYLARLGVEVDYVTALGDDSMSAWMLAQWREEGVGCNLVARYPDSVPGLYMIQVDGHGERSFLYWRENSPATRLFDDPVTASVLFDKLLGYPQIYLSGITLALYAEPARHRLFDFLARYRDQGGKVIFDGNYRPRLWAGPEVARDAYEHMYRVCDLVLPTDEDEAMLFGIEEPQAVLKRLRSYGVEEVILKMGANGCWIGNDCETEWLASESVEVVDSTAAGDSFNAGYMAAKFGGSTATEAAVVAHKLASTVIRYRGAIIPSAAMPS